MKQQEKLIRFNIGLTPILNQMSFLFIITCYKLCKLSISPSVGEAKDFENMEQRLQLSYIYVGMAILGDALCSMLNVLV